MIFELNQHVNERVEKIGTDGKFIQDRNGKIYHVSLLEKLLVPMLVKFFQLYPSGWDLDEHSAPGME